jgi:hydroxypyruvate reductase
MFRRTLSRLDPDALVADYLVNVDISANEVVLVAVGKAALGMASGAHRILGRRLVGGVVVAPELGEVPRGLRCVAGTHPAPTLRSVRAGRALLAAVAGAAPHQEVLALISGGASALAAIPAGGLLLADKVAAVTALSASGAPIRELNALRKHLSELKGGRLAAAAPAAVTSLVLSDVVGDDLAAVGSGPTIPDPTTFADACAIIERRVGWAAVPGTVREHLRGGAAGKWPETAKQARPGDRAFLVAGTATLAHRAADAARAKGFEAEIFSEENVDDVDNVAAEISVRARGARSAGRTVCLVGGGEPTVKLCDEPGQGGRAQHLALLVARRISGLSDVAVLVAGSDGIDGNSPAAGAVVDGTTWEAMRAAGIDPEAALAECDSHRALAAVGAALVTGRTGINHADLVMILVTARR